LLNLVTLLLQIAIVRFASDDVICMETFKDHPQLGRFTLRDEGAGSHFLKPGSVLQNFITAVITFFLIKILKNDFPSKNFDRNIPAVNGR
jgi:hypothetical protein